MVVALLLALTACSVRSVGDQHGVAPPESPTATLSVVAAPPASATPSAPPVEEPSGEPSSAATDDPSHSTGPVATPTNIPSQVALPAGPLAPVLHRVATPDKVVFITIDDGWTKDPAFIDLVRQRKIPLTLFLTQAAARSDYGYFKELQSLGAMIEDHTLSHPNLTKVDDAEKKHQICSTADIYTEKFGRRPLLLRPPYGATNKQVQQAAAACGMKAVVNWSETVNGAKVQYANGTAFAPGDIVLMHFVPDIVANMNALLDEIHDQGYSVGLLENYLALS